MTAATPDTKTEPHRLELHLLLPELFPDVAAVRSFFGSSIYRSLLAAMDALATGEEPIRDDAGGGWVKVRFDLETLGSAVGMAEGTPLRCERDARDHQSDIERQLRGLVASMAITGDGDADLIGRLASYVSFPDPRELSALGAAEDADDAA